MGGRTPGGDIISSSMIGGSSISSSASLVEMEEEAPVGCGASEAAGFFFFFFFTTRWSGFMDGLTSGCPRAGAVLSLSRVKIHHDGPLLAPLPCTQTCAHPHLSASHLTLKNRYLSPSHLPCPSIRIPPLRRRRTRRSLTPRIDYDTFLTFIAVLAHPCLPHLHCVNSRPTSAILTRPLPLSKKKNCVSTLCCIMSG